MRVSSYRDPGADDDGGDTDYFDPANDSSDNDDNDDNNNNDSPARPSIRLCATSVKSSSAPSIAALQRNAASTRDFK